MGLNTKQAYLNKSLFEHGISVTVHLENRIAR